MLARLEGRCGRKSVIHWKGESEARPRIRMS